MMPFAPRLADSYHTNVNTPDWDGYFPDRLAPNIHLVPATTHHAFIDEIGSERGEQTE